MDWKPPDRNFDNIQFADLRKTLDDKFNQVHDELSDCFYNGKPFRTYGILTKDQFDKLHGLIFLQRDVTFHEENMKSAVKDQIPEDEYNFIDDAKTVKKSDQAAVKINGLKAQGIELVI